MSRSRLAATLVAATMLVVLLTAWIRPPLRTDDRVTIESPRADAVLTLPVRIRWRADNLDIRSPGAHQRGYYFGVFIDRRPPRPGESLLAFVDSECAAAGHGCATREYFRSRNVYLTSEMSLDIATLAPLSIHRPDTRLHTATIVLMGRDDRRVGEGAWQRSFRLAAM